MAYSFRSLRPLALLALVSLRVLGQQLDAKLSFGHENPITPDPSSPPKGWSMLGEPYPPKIYSDRIVLTPPYPGGAKAALWTDDKNNHPEFVASLEFRVNGPDGGDGSLHLWYEKEGRGRVGSSTIHTIDKFDGLALVIDNYGGKGGSIRALLNDGSTDFKTTQNIDTLAFGHCNFQYRNLGRPIELKLTQSSSLFKLEVDGRECFTSQAIKLPHDYYFGLVGSSANNPDSFEVFKFSVNSDVYMDHGRHQQQEQQKQQQQQQQQQKGQTGDSPSQDGFSERFDRLNNRLDEMMTLITNLDERTSKLSENSDKHYDELMKSHARMDRLAQFNVKLETIERVIYAIKADVEGKEFREHLTNLRQTVEDTHSSLMRHLPQTLGHIVTSAAPRMSVVIFLFLITQIILFGGYVLYKRRLKMQPKKYL